MKKYVIIFCLLITACATHTTNTYDPSLNRFDAAHDITPKKERPYPREKRPNKIMITLSHINKKKEFAQSVQQAFKNMGFVDVVTIIQDENTNLKTLYDQYPKDEYLYGNITKFFIGQHGLTLTIFAPESRDILLSCENESRVWTSYPRELYAPIYNCALDWFKRNNFK